MFNHNIRFRFFTGKLFVTIFFTFSLLIHASEPPKKSLLVGINSHVGFIIPHSSAIRSVSYSHPWVIEIDLSWHHLNEKAWNYCNCFPRTGINISYINFDNPEVLGSGFALAPYVEPFAAADRRFTTSFRLGGGAVYLNNIYDPVTNPDNQFYCTHFSFILFMSFSANYRLTKDLNIKIAANYNHISNGGNKQPNYGINFPTASIGLDYYLQSPYFERFDKKIKDDRKKTLVKASVFYTPKEYSKADRTKYPVFGVHAGAERLVGRISALSAGLEYMNDYTQKEWIIRKELNVNDHQQVAILAGHVFHIGRFSFSQSLGIYIYDPLSAVDAVYQRYGLEYRLYKRFHIGTNLKAHRHMADFLDFRLSYNIL